MNIFMNNKEKKYLTKKDLIEFLKDCPDDSYIICYNMHSREYKFIEDFETNKMFIIKYKIKPDLIESNEIEQRDFIIEIDGIKYRRKQIDRPILGEGYKIVTEQEYLLNKIEGDEMIGFMIMN